MMTHFTGPTRRLFQGQLNPLGTTFRASSKALAILMLFIAPLLGAEPQPRLAGDMHIHDPSIIEVGGKFVAFGTGEQGRNRGAIRVKTSPDGVTWKNRGPLGDGVPPWVEAKLGFQPSNIWAPSISRRGEVFSLYYSLSSFGTNTSVIGLMTNESFDPERPGEGWRDQGEVIRSRVGDDFNAIDPFRINLADGRAFLSYGSFWSGIKLRELDPETGKLISADTPIFALAARAGGGAVEASALLEHAGKFYLFVSFDQCCKGVASTYNIRIGRADRIEGPYRDRQGNDMRRGGGSLLQATSRRYMGPGGQEPVKTSKGEMLAYHYYDGGDGGASKLQFSPIGWTEDGWPELGALPEECRTSTGYVDCVR
jgi:arabinan endo-1,5-alpha-L-arabinosidase